MRIRELAYEILDSVYKKGTYVNIGLSQAIRNHQLSDSDRAFLTRLVYGVIQNNNLLDYEIKQAIEDKKIKPDMRTLLKMSLYQLRFMDRIPDYAVINEAVEICKAKMGRSASSFCNAVLRRLQKERFYPQESSFPDELTYLSTLYSHPLWMVKMMAKQYGEDVAKNWVINNHNEKKLVLRINNLKGNKQELLKTGDFKENKLCPSALDYLGKGNPATSKEFLDGKYVIQDAAGQLVAYMLDSKENERVLDMCAAPGSKTYHIADLMNNKGQIIAVDFYHHRLDLLKNNLPRLGISIVKTICYDSTKLTEILEEESFDRVLLDAPCSGLGVIYRKPDILINLKQENLDGIIELQRGLIDQAVKLVKKGGVLVYSTCTIDKKENEGQIIYLTSKYPEFKLIDSKMILPNKEESAGFFIAKLEKV